MPFGPVRQPPKPSSYATDGTASVGWVGVMTTVPGMSHPASVLSPAVAEPLDAPPATWMPTCSSIGTEIATLFAL